MGVQGLWELLAPVGRRVSVETLAGKKLAIDASIWMVQFMKAMRDEKGEMVRNAHLLGFFRRICKLLFLRTRPVFVFDGGTPALKRRTVAARRRHRENARAKIRKTAEKLLLNHLKAKKLEDLAAEIKNSRAKGDAKGKGVVSEHENHVAGSSIRQGADESGLGAISQEGLDEMLAASLAAEEEGNSTVDEPASSGKFPAEVAEDEDEDEDEEMSIPVIDGNVDPTVLASLPPSMQLDLLVQMRESLMAENRQKYQKIKKFSEFSELQIQSYLKTVAFRKEIDEVQKFAAGRGPEGIQTSRIASEANREFIFSSSFTGDKTVFTSAAVEKNGNAGKIESYSGKGSASLDSLSVHSSSSQMRSTSQVNVVGPTKDFGHDIETYLDERGRVRVSRVRGLGIRMTRDLQRNLDLLKEYEIEATEKNVHQNLEPISSKEAFSTSHNYSKNGFPINIGDSEEPYEDLHRCQGNNMQKIQKDQRAELSAMENDTTLEVSFSVDDTVDRDDDVFSQLVAGSSIVQHSEVCFLEKSSIGCESDFEWEEGVIEDRDEGNKTDRDNVSQASFEERDGHENDEAHWEEGEIQTASAHQIEHVKPFSRGSLEEELEVQEAIRRSLEDLGQQINTGSLHVQTPKMSAVGSSATPLQCDSQSPRQHALIVDGFKLSDSAVQGCSLQSFDSVEKLSATTSTYNSTELSVTDERKRKFQVTNHASITPSDTDSRIMEKSQPDVAPTTVLVGVQISEQESCLDMSSKDDNKSSLRIETDFSTPDSSNLCLRNTGIPDGDLDRAHGRDLPSNCQIPEEDYIFDTSISDGGFHAEVMESTLDEELLLLSRERMDLSDEQRKLERNAESVNNEMFAECQELLQMFGLPFIIAPMEAEAQCAYMEQVNLVDGVVTDDSDVFLFGAQNVYKNIFDDRKYVETYLMKDMEKELGLTREMLIRMALLLGSDYTEGVSGIGIVNAIEVVHAFPEEDGLKKFREWVESPDPAILGKLYPHISGGTKKRSSKADNGEDTSSIGTKENDVHSSDAILDVKRTFMDKHRNVSKNWHIPLSFPSDSVISAYISPQVDESTEPFAWGKPDLPLLRKLCWGKFGWANQKADELLVPVLKEYNKHETQLRLEAFYTFNEKFAKIRSQRIKKAVKGITGSSLIGLTGDLEQGDVKVKKKRRQTSEVEENRDEKHPDGRCDGRKHSRQPKEQKSEKLSDGRLPESLLQSGVVKETNESNVNEDRGRGRRGGGRGGKGRKRRTREIEDHSFESAETSSSDCSYHSTEKKMQVEQTCSSELRRSLRQRKHVQYTEEENVDDDGLSDRSKDKREVCLDEPAAARELNDSSNPDGNKDNHRDMSVIGDICTFGGRQTTSDSDYLFSGGGFCVDDDDDLNDNPTQKISGAQENPLDSLSNMTGAPNDLDMDMEHSFDGNLKNVQDPPLQAAPVRHEETDVFKEQGAGHQTGYGFTSMTSLRRKRK